MRAAPAYEAVRQAAGAASEAAELWTTLLANREAGARMVLEHLITVGELPAGSTLEGAVDVLWFFNDPAHHSALVGGRGWSDDQFRDWLAEQMCRALLGNRGDR